MTVVLSITRGTDRAVDRVEAVQTAAAAPAFRDANVRETPLGRTGTAHEVAPLVGSCWSDKASFITGAEIPVDGGLTAHGGVKSVSDALREPAAEPFTPVVGPARGPGVS